MMIAVRWSSDALSQIQAGFGSRLVAIRNNGGDDHFVSDCDRACPTPAGNVGCPRDVLRAIPVHRQSDVIGENAIRIGASKSISVFRLNQRGRQQRQEKRAADQCESYHESYIRSRRVSWQGVLSGKAGQTSMQAGKWFRRRCVGGQKPFETAAELTGKRLPALCHRSCDLTQSLCRNQLTQETIHATCRTRLATCRRAQS